MNKAFILGVVVCLTLPLFGCASKQEPRQTSMIDNAKKSVMNPAVWRDMTEIEKKNFARKSLEDVGENPDAFVSQGRTREGLLLEGLEAVYSK